MYACKSLRGDVCCWSVVEHEAGKTLFVPTPGMLNHVVSKLTLPEIYTKRSLRTTVTRHGVLEFSEPVDIDCTLKMDLVIVGSAAVSTKGTVVFSSSSLLTRLWLDFANR